MSDLKGKSVDEIWRELNSRPAFPRSRTTGVPGFGLPGVATHTRVLPSTKAAAPAQVGGVHLSSSTAPDGAARHDNRRSVMQAYDPAQAGVTAEQVSAFMAGMQRTVNCLSDVDRATRRQAAAALQARLAHGDVAAGVAPPSPELLQALVCGPLLLPLVALLSDPVERCRSSALGALANAVATIPDAVPPLAVLVPALAARMGSLPVQEASEELRLAVIELLRSLVGKVPGSALAGYLPDMEAILCRGLEDAYPEVKKAACSVVTTLALQTPHSALEPHIEKLLQALLANVSHAHSRVRLAVVAAVDVLVAAGPPAGVVADVVAPGIRPLAADHAPQVREALYVAVASWLGCPTATRAGAGADALSRCSTYAPLLLPLLLLGITDAQDSIGAHALALLEQVGALHAGGLAPHALAAQGAGHPEEAAQCSMAAQEPEAAVAGRCEQGVDMGDGPASAAAASTSDGTNPGTAGEARSSGRLGLNTLAGPAHPSSAAVAAAQLGPPFQGLPSPGARQLVRSHLRSMVAPALRELGEWTSTQRLAAARLLHVMLVLAAEGAEPQLPALVPALVGAVGDDEQGVVSRVLGCARALGAFVPPRAWLPLLVDQLAGGRHAPGHRASALVLTSAALRAAAGAGHTADGVLVAVMVAALCGEELAAAGVEHEGVRLQLVASVTNLLRWAGPQALAEDGMARLYCVMLQMAGAAQVAGQHCAVADIAMDQLAEVAGLHLSDGRLASAAGAPAAPLDSAETAPMIVDEHSAGTLQSSGAAPAAGWGAAALSEACGAAALAAATADVEGWGSAAAPGWCMLSALLSGMSRAALAALTPGLTSALGPLLADHERDAGLRLAVLAALGSAMEDAQRGAALGGAAHTRLVVEHLLLPPLTWRAGKTAAAVRFSAMRALGAMLSQRLASREVLAAMMREAPMRPAAGAAAATASAGRADQAGGCQLLPLVLQCMDEDWYSDVRLVSCYVLECLLDAAAAGCSADEHASGPALPAEELRTIYPELLKRLDDSVDGVRIAACDALRAFARAAGNGWDATNAGYLAAGIAIHMDDSNPEVAEAAASALEALGAVQAEAVACEVRKARERFRSKHLCDRVVNACSMQVAHGPE